MTLDVDMRTRVGGFVLEAAITAEPGEVLAVLGPNGSGKSTLLGVIAGHVPMVEGRISLDGRMLDDTGSRSSGAHTAGTGRRLPLPPEHRRIGMIGQRAMLFPHLTALENAAFGPRSQGMPRARARTIARDRLAEVGLGGLAQRRPSELSGGQQQRVALARALAASPDALLLDEPFASLDAQSAAQARKLIAVLRDRIGVPMMLVTHDPMDAIVLAARTVVLHDGRVVQDGPTHEVLGHPRSPFVATVAGVNMIEGSGDASGMLNGPDGLRWVGLGDRLGFGETGTAVFAPSSVRIDAASVRIVTETVLGERGTAVNRWAGTVHTMEPTRGGIRLSVAEYPDLLVDCPATTAATVGVRPGVLLSFSIAEEDVSLRRHV